MFCVRCNGLKDSFIKLCIRLTIARLCAYFPFLSIFILYCFCSLRISLQRNYSEIYDTSADSWDISKPPAGTKLRMGSMIALRIHGWLQVRKKQFPAIHRTAPPIDTPVQSLQLRHDNVQELAAVKPASHATFHDLLSGTSKVVPVLS